MSEADSGGPHDPSVPESKAPPHLPPSAQSEPLMRESSGQTSAGGMAGTAERIGSAVGSAQRQLRRGLELVRPATQPILFPSQGAENHAAERVEQAARESADWDSVMALEIADVRHEAADQLDAWSEEAVEHLEHLRSTISDVFSQTRQRARRFVAVYPLQTIAAIAGVCFAAGLALRLGRRSHRG